MTDREWTVALPRVLEEQLARSFRNGPILEGTKHLLEEELVANLDGLKIEVFSREHPPPHFRVCYAGETANYTIAACSQLNGGLKKWYKNIKEWHVENKQQLIDIWNTTRPTDCPVGQYREP